jgi:hypothetical protein
MVASVSRALNDLFNPKAFDGDGVEVGVFEGDEPSELVDWMDSILESVFDTEDKSESLAFLLRHLYLILENSPFRASRMSFFRRYKVALTMPCR